MAVPSFFHRELPAVGGTVTLNERESHHAAGARRLRVGDLIKVLDGAGVIADAVIESISKNALDVSITARQLVPVPLRSVHMYCALPKGDRQRTMLEMLTQIGISGFTPVQCERSVVKPRSVNMQRLQRIAVEACKQSQNAYLPKLFPSLDLATAVEDACVSGACCLLADPAGRSLTLPEQPQINAFIGPEGGFTDAELKRLSAAGAQPVSLSDNILRMETAAVLLAGMLLC